MSDNYNQPPVIINERTNESITDANIRIGNLRNTVTDLEIKLEALYRILVERGIDPKVFEDKIEEIMKEKDPVNQSVQALQAQNQSKPCPKCGRPVKKNSNTPLFGKCMYCGLSIPFYPSFKSGEST